MTNQFRAIDTRNCDQVFYAIAPIVVDRWTNPLDVMGDVASLAECYGSLRRKCDACSHCLPPWFLPALFFVGHQLRFSALLAVFQEECASCSALWVEQSEEALEEALRRHMSDMWGPVEAHWAVITASGDEEHEQYLLERALVPNQMLKFIAGYKNGPKHWLWGTFPFKTCGQLLAGLLCSTSNFTKERNKLMTAMPAEVRCGKYTITHKMRTFLVVEGMAHNCSQDDWYGANTMSDSNKQILKDLGQPTLEEVSHLLGRRVSPLEVGFHLCFVGGVISAHGSKMSADLTGCVDTLRAHRVNGSPWRSPELHLQEVFLSSRRRQAKRAAPAMAEDAADGACAVARQGAELSGGDRDESGDEQAQRARRQALT